MVTIDPVVIEGDATVQQLVKKHAAVEATRDCTTEARTAANTAGNIVVGVLGTLAGVSTFGPFGLAAGLAGLFKASIDTGKDLRAYYDCKTQ